MTMAACTNAGGLIASRVFLGIPESGVVTCGVMYFSFWVRLPINVMSVLTSSCSTNPRKELFGSACSTVPTPLRKPSRDPLRLASTM